MGHDWPQLKKTASQVHGEVLIVDSFGNLITNIERADIAALGSQANLNIRCGSRKIRGIVHTYGAAMTGEAIALFDSQDRLEIAVVGGSAAEQLKIAQGQPVVVSDH
jgi:S-adenosylmethionine hydrolase